MDTKDYEQKISELLEDSVYKKLNKDPTATWERKVMNELKKLSDESSIEPGLRDRLRPIASRPPKFYGLTKIHKPDVPLRPIASCIGSPTYNLAKYMTRLISPLCGKIPSFVKNSQHFVEMIREMKLEENEVLESFDVKSLFTNVPVDKELLR